MTKERWWAIIASAVAVLLAFNTFKCKWFGLCPTPAAVTHVTLDLEGGFAYVKQGSDLHVSFMKDTQIPATGDPTTMACDVHQLGVSLTKEADGGTFVQPPESGVPPNGIDLTNATVTIDNIATLGPLVAGRGASPPTPPQPAHAAEWQDLKWVASVKDHYGSALAANWSSFTSGRLMLTRGTLIASPPTDAFMYQGVWQLRADGAAGPAPFTQAMTNVTQYTVDVFGDDLSLNVLQAGQSTPTKIVVHGNASRQVKLLIQGIHDTAPTNIPIDTPITDYCAFYRLLDPVPDSATWLIPRWKGKPGGGSGQGAASPGGACPGDYVP